MVFLKFAIQELHWNLRDTENFVMPIDYHNQRIALRYGLVVPTPSLSKALVAGDPIDEKTHHSIRKTCQEAYHHVVINTHHSLFTIDSLLWNIGRNCCPYDSAPHCNDCPLPQCYFQNLIPKTSLHSCPLNKNCRGVQSENFRHLKECNVKTNYY